MTHAVPERAQAIGGRPSKRRRRRSGQSLVEFVLVAPIMLLFFLAIADMARLYTTMMTVEAAAREAADFGAFDSQYWTDPDGVRTQMTHRACLASSKLPDYVGTTDSSAATCTNPEVREAVAVPQPGSNPAASPPCTDSLDPYPCWVRVTLEYDFQLIMPINITLPGGGVFGFPSQLTFQRSSTFAMTDLQLPPGP